jgi:hypothetical protein
LNLKTLPLPQLQLLQQHARRSDIAAAIESCISSLQVSVRAQQLDVWSFITPAAASAAAREDEHVVCAVCLEQLCGPPSPLPASRLLTTPLT